MGQEIAEVATTCFVITLVVRSPLSGRPRWLLIARLPHRVLPSASCCFAWRQLLRAMRSKT